MGSDVMVQHLAQAAIRRKLRAAERLARRTRNAPDRLPAAWFLTDPDRTPDPCAIAARLPSGWGVIYRHFGAADRADVARRLARICRRRGLVLLIAADPELARRVRADGVHWPEQRLPAHVPRRPGWIVTAAAHDLAGLRRANRAGGDAALLSPVFASRSPSAGRPIGAAGYLRITKHAPLPVLALAGVEARTAAATVSTHAPRAAGWAAIDGVMAGWT
jgi:thiamine-phosphate pyrophosphorylase